MSAIPEEFLKEIDTVFQQCAISNFLNDAQLRDTLCTQLDCALVAMEEAFQVMYGIASYETDMATLRQLQSRARGYHRVLMASVNTCSIVSQRVALLQPQCTGNPGRPRLIVNIEQAELLRTSGFTWEEVSQIVGVSRTTLWRRFHKLGIPIQKYSEVSDSSLDCLVGEIQRNNPNIGVAMLQGYLRSQGCNIQRRRVRESVLRMSPMRAIVRWRQSISRRSYWVPGPNSLWHIDGHHSLIRWRFVVHGCIDGFSRMITYLSCSTDNLAETVLRLFRQATSDYGMPSRVRSDRGGENALVCHLMVSQRGPGRGSHIAGSSVHNQRVERLWRDVYRCVCSSFHEIFYFLEAQEVLDPDNECDLFVLHCVFQPVINHHLQAFVQAWNRHPLRTERNWSPYKIWVNGMIDPDRRHLTGVRDVVDGTSPVPIEDFGRDDEGPFPDEQAYTVYVPEVVCPLPNSMMESFMQTDSVNIDDAVSEYMTKRVHLASLTPSSDQDQ